MFDTPSPTCLQAQDLCVYAGSQPLLRDVSLSLATGQVGALLGPNGAGKSTLLGVMAGLRAPDRGTVTLDGEPLTPKRLPQLAQRRSVLPQDTLVAFDFTAREVVELARYPHRLQPSRNEAGIVQGAMQMTETWHLAQQRLAWLSGGERLRVQLARVMAQIWEPRPDGASRWLLLDEPTSALDLQHQHAVLHTVREWAHQQGVGVLMVLHDLNLALRYADCVWVLEQGALRAQGVATEVLGPDLLAEVWKVSSTPVQDRQGVAQVLTAASS